MYSPLFLQSHRALVIKRSNRLSYLLLPIPFPSARLESCHYWTIFWPRQRLVHSASLQNLSPLLQDPWTSEKRNDQQARLVNLHAPRATISK